MGLVHAMMLDIEYDLDAPKKYPQKDPDKTGSTQRTNVDPLVLMMLSSRNVTASKQAGAGTNLPSTIQYI